MKCRMMRNFIWVFTVCKNTCLGVSRIQKVKRSERKYINQNVSEFDQEIPQSHTADQPTAPWERVTEHLQ